MARASSGNDSEEAWGALRMPQQQVSQQLQKPITTAIYFYFPFPCPFLSGAGGGTHGAKGTVKFLNMSLRSLSKLCNVDVVDFACSFTDPIP